MMDNQLVLHFLRWLIIVLLTFNDNRQPDLSHYVKDIHPSIHSSIHHFCVNCHLSIIMVCGCWSPSQQSLGKKQECDEKSYEMEFHFYCLFSHCQRVKVLNLCTLTNEATLRGDPNWCLSLFSWSAPFCISNEGSVWAAACFEGTSDVLCVSFSFTEKKALSKHVATWTGRSIWNAKGNRTNQET